VGEAFGDGYGDVAKQVAERFEAVMDTMAEKSTRNGHVPEPEAAAS
jgi:hypothetical protein